MFGGIAGLCRTRPPRPFFETALRVNNQVPRCGLCLCDVGLRVILPGAGVAEGGKRGEEGRGCGTNRSACCVARVPSVCRVGR